MKKYIKVFITILLLLSFFGCKKYPEDEYFITLKSVEKRLTGTWNIYEYKTNGIDSLNLFDSTEFKTNVSILEAKPDDGVGGDFVHISDIYGLWSLENGKSQLKFRDQRQYNTNNIFHCFGPFISDKTIIWDIQKLTMEDLWIETNFENNNYLLKLKSINKQYE